MAQSPADRQAEANRQVERATKALYECVRPGWQWEGVHRTYKEEWRGHIRALVAAGVITLPPAPPSDEPIPGQLTIDD